MKLLVKALFRCRPFLSSLLQNRKHFIFCSFVALQLLLHSNKLLTEIICSEWWHFCVLFLCLQLVEVSSSAFCRRVGCHQRCPLLFYLKSQIIEYCSHDTDLLAKLLQNWRI